MTPVAIKHKAEIIKRISNGEPVTDIAKSLGYADHSGIIHRLGDDEEYKAAMRASVFAKIEKREKELENATDSVSVTKSDRLLGHARWWAERLDPQRFNAKVEGNAGITVQVIINDPTKTITVDNGEE